jgi:hypothetical protein
VKTTNQQLFAHLAIALSRYFKEVRREGVTPPPELLTLAEFFTDCARVRQDPTSLARSVEVEDGVAMSKHLMLTKREAAAELRISVRSLERILARLDSGLRAVQVEGGVRIRRADLDAYVAGLSGRSFRDQVEEKTA